MTWEEEIDRDFEIFRDPEWLELLSDPVPKRRRQRKPSLARLVTKAKQLRVDVTVEPNGSVTFHTGSSITAESTINEWNEVLPHHGKH